MDIQKNHSDFSIRKSPDSAKKILNLNTKIKKKRMKKLFFGKISIQILPLFLLFFHPEIQNHTMQPAPQRNNTCFTGFSFEDFTKKNYYKKIFNAEDIKKLSEIEVLNKKNEENIAKAQKYFSKAENYKKVVELSPSEKDRKKAARKAEKFDNKASKRANNSLESTFNNNSLKYSIYLKRLQEIQSDNTPEHKEALDLKNEAGIDYEKARELYKKSQTASEMGKYTLLKEAISMQKLSFDKQESAFGFFMHDPEFKIETKNEITKDSIITVFKDSNVVVIKEIIELSKQDSSSYSIERDSNLYISKLPILLQKIEFSPIDQQELLNLKPITDRANLIRFNTEELYFVIDSLHQKAEGEPDKKIKEQITQQAVSIEKNAFDSLLISTNLYLKTNETLYRIYSKYLAMYRPAGDTKGKKYENSAEDYHSQSQSLSADANLQSYKHERYIKLMNANLLLLTAIQQQENAYCSYFGLSESPLIEQERYLNENDNMLVKNNVVIQNRNTSKDVNRKKSETYIYAGTYFYNNENPSPVLIVHKKGLIFKVQIGVFKELLPLKSFSEFSPISFDSYRNTSLKRFMLGEYRSEEAAELALQRIYEKGFPDAFIVCYVDGVRNSYAYGKTLINRNEEYSKFAENEVNWFKNLPISYNDDQTISNKDNKQSTFQYGSGLYDFAQGKDISKEKGLMYSVQIGMYQLPRTNEEIKLLSPLYEEKTKDGTKYLIGNFANYQAAVKEKTKISEMGFRESFVSAYNNGKQISLAKASKMEPQKENITMKDEIFFQVQIGAYASKLPADKEKSYLELSKTNPVTAKTDENGLVIYIVGKTKSYSEAIQLRNNMKIKGFNDGFVIAYKNGKKISVIEALKLLN